MTLATSVSAAGWNHSLAVSVGASTLGQFGLGASENRKESDRLLKAARQALNAGRLDEAGESLKKAEALGVKYDLLSSGFGETPEKVRRDLDVARAKAKPSETKAPGMLSVPSATAKDPLKKAGDAEAALASLTDDAKARAKQALDTGRRALESGDHVAAQAAYQKAAAIKTSYQPNEYSPERLAADLRSVGIDVSTLPAAAPTARPPAMLNPNEIVQERPLPEARTPARPENLADAFRSGGEFTPNNLPPDTNPLSASPAAKPNTNDFPVADQSQPLPRVPGVGKEAKAEAQRLTALAIAAKDRGNLQEAAKLAEQAQAMNIPDAAFGANETRPWQVALEINKEVTRRQGMTTASGTIDDRGVYGATQGAYDPSRDQSRNVRVQSETPAINPNQLTGSADQLYREGLQALDGQDRAGALAKFQAAWRKQDQLDPELRQKLKDKLAYLQTAPAVLPRPNTEPSRLEEVDSEQKVRFQKLLREVTTERDAAEKLAAEDPKKALANLKALRQRVTESDVDPLGKKQLLTLLDRSVTELETFVNRYRGDIELKERNSEVQGTVERERQSKVESQTKYAKLVEEFNKLMDEERFPEAEAIAKQARELDPTNPVTETLTWKATFAKRLADSNSLQRRKEYGVIGALDSVDESAIPTDDRHPISFGNVENWKQLAKGRAKAQKNVGQRLNPAEQEIQKSLGRQIEAAFQDKPLHDVLDTLGKMAGINIVLDPQGLHSEAVAQDTPVSLVLNNPVSLKSALNLILTPLRLDFAIQNEVLLVTSKDRRRANVYSKVYYVADLVTPIPNFLPNNNIGLPGAIREGYHAMGYGASFRDPTAGPVPFTIAQDQLQGGSSENPLVMAQMLPPGLNVPLRGRDGAPLTMPTQPQQAASRYNGVPPSAYGGGVTEQDFEALINLITSTISPDTWAEGEVGGGEGQIRPFPANLSLVVSNTQDVHSDIEALLQQLRDLQDLQVTIEVRFLNLQDDFFERIGVDFDFKVDDNTVLSQQRDDDGRSIAYGITGTDAGNNLATGDRDFTFRQNSFASAVPQFGGFDANTAASFGFAILSDIEVFFLLNALNGDNRTNILQAPKVTLFNGQFANVQDVQRRLFVTSIIPVVGDFAAAHQPVVSVLNDGTQLTVQAVVSQDRRFVRLTLMPMFTKIGTVETFTFNGRTTSNTGTTVSDPTDPTKKVTNGASTVNEGSTVQLPTVAETSVFTTVSVPDGGTVLLGGVKRLSESRNERGVPILGKVPYINRLFRNNAIGRTTSSLMMMVTPRIIIKAEEEERIGIANIEP